MLGILPIIHYLPKAIIGSKSQTNFKGRPTTVAQHVAHPLVVGEVISSNLIPSPRHKNDSYNFYVMEIPWPKIGATHYHTYI